MANAQRNLFQGENSAAEQATDSVYKLNKTEEIIARTKAPKRSLDEILHQGTTMSRLAVDFALAKTMGAK